jgi:hypothetical protein
MLIFSSCGFLSTLSKCLSGLKELRGIEFVR